MQPALPFLAAEVTYVPELAVAVLVFIGLGLYVHHRVTWRRSLARRVAMNVLTLRKALYGRGPHDLGPADLREYAWMNLERYAAVRRELEALGFRYVADLENRTVQAVLPGLATFVRTLVHEEKRMLAQFCIHRRVAPEREDPEGKPIIETEELADLTSRLDDGSLILTTTAVSISCLDEVPNIHRRFLPTGTPIPKMIEAHEKHVAERLKSHPGAQLETVPATVDELVEASHRSHELRASYYRQFPGYLPKEEYRRIAADMPDNDFDLVWEEVEKLIAEEGKKP